MKALSLKPPWAWLVVNGIKPVENRKWRSSYRGPLLIHASRTWDQASYELILSEPAMHNIANVPDKDDHVFGAIVGHVNMVDCVKQYASRWFFGPYGFVFTNPKAFKQPIPYQGQLGIFDVSNEVIRYAL